MSSTIDGMRDVEKLVFDLEIFAFDADDGSFVGRFSDGNNAEIEGDAPGMMGPLEIMTENGRSTATIAGRFLRENKGRTLVFYFIANNQYSKGGSHTANIDFSAITSSQFENALTAEIPESPFEPGKSDAIEDLEFIAFEGLLATAKSDPIKIIGAQRKNIKLINRVARFDIKNTNTDKYAISGVYVSNAPLQGQLFPDSRTQTVIGVRSYSEVTFGHKYENNIRHAVFYLYPTTLGEGATEITILITRLADNATAFVTLEGTTEIKANHRYTLVFDADDMTFTLPNGRPDYGEGGNNP